MSENIKNVFERHSKSIVLLQARPTASVNANLCPDLWPFPAHNNTLNKKGVDLCWLNTVELKQELWKMKSIFFSFDSPCVVVSVGEPRKVMTTGWVG